MPEIRQSVSGQRPAGAELEGVIRAVLASPAAKLFFFDSLWVCPLCGQMGCRAAPSQPWTDHAARHLREACPAIQAGRRVVEVTPEQHRTNALQQGIKYNLASNPAWRCHDRSGHWYCPYCIERGVKLRKPGVFLFPDLEAISAHILHCFYFDSGRGKVKDVAHLQEVVRQADARLEAVQDFRPRLAGDPVWRFRDRNGCWVCPYCRRGIVSVNFSPARSDGAVEDVGNHLLKHCEAYRRKAAPARDVAELAGSGGQPQPVARTVQAEREFVQVDKKVYDLLVRQAKATAEARGDAGPGIDRTLASAQKRQLKMLPKPPLVAGFEIEVLFKPSHQLSGDFYDFVKIDDDRLGILIGDVSGHGVDAALVMGMVKKVLSLAGKSQPTPKDVLSYANELISPDLDRSTFVTACYGLLHTRDRVFQFARAGHNPVLVYNPARGDLPIALRPDGMALGIAAVGRVELGLEEMELPLMAGDTVVLYTDGAVEQANGEGEMLQLDGFLDILRESAGKDAHSLLKRIEARLEEYRGEVAQEDDITIVCFRVL